MKAVKDGSYRKKGTGNLVFRYKVVGTPAEIEAYKKAQGENLREADDGSPLYFSTRNIGDVCPLGISQTSGNVFADTSEMDAAANLAAQYGGNLGTEIAKIAAAKFLGNRGTASTTPVAEESKADLSQS